jgi:formylglycine-generating enzyme required for sulfatase activity
MAFADELTGAVVKHLRPGSVPGLGTISMEIPVGGRHGRQKQKQTQLAFLVAGIFALVVCAAMIVTLWFPRNSIFLPTDVAAGTFQPVKDTELVTVGGKPYYKQIECRIGADPELVVRFNLIPWYEIGKQSFYLMENKVSNDVYRAFAKSGRLPLSGARWELGARVAPQLTEEQLEKRQGSLPYAIYPFFSLFAGPSLLWNGPALYALDDNDGDNVFAVLVQENWPVPDDMGAANHPKWPVLRVDIQEAHLCAQWLGGFLPTAEQWDTAAGVFADDRGLGPFVSPFAADEIAVDRAHRGPLPVGSAVKDVVPFSGCRDMSGNGLEWTRSIIFDNDAKEYIGNTSKVNALAKVQLRGQRFSAPEPLTYAVLKERALELPFHQRRRPPGEDIEIGFRIAVLLP